jgi:hypothetical protein
MGVATGSLKRIVLGAGLAVSLAGVAQIPSAAYGDSCYPTCNAPTVPTNGGGGVTSPATSSNSGGQAPVQAPSSALAFTGTDIEELSAIGVAAILGGGLLVRRGRRRARSIVA